MVDETQPGPSEFELAGLYDPGAADAPERLALLEYMLEIGATIDDLLSVHGDEYPLLASRIALWGARESFTLEEAAAGSGLDPAVIERAWRAAGFPDAETDGEPRTYSARDIATLEIARAGIELFGEEVTIQLLRVIGAAATRVADAVVSAFVVNVASAAAVSDASGLALARANVDSMATLDGLTYGFDTLLRHHMERGFRPFDVMEMVSGIDVVRRSVGFADLVDSTAWAQQLELPALSGALGDFDATASEIVVRGGGKVVKLIGDEIMFVADDAVTAAGIGLALTRAFGADDVLPPVRVGIATGDVLARDGDYSGPIVNLAARAVKLAAPATVLVDEVTRGELRGAAGFETAPARSYPLKGFAEPVALTQVTDDTRR